MDSYINVTVPVVQSVLLAIHIYFYQTGPTQTFFCIWLLESEVAMISSIDVTT